MTRECNHRQSVDQLTQTANINPSLVPTFQKKKKQKKKKPPKNVKIQHLATRTEHNHNQS